jgi:hypothetical protein
MLVEKMHSMLIGSKAPGYLWSEALNTTNYLINRGPIQANSGVTPEERYRHQVPNVSHLKTWECLVYFLVPKGNRNKLDNKTVPCQFVSYNEKTKAFRLYLPDKQKVAINKEVTFDEGKLGLIHFGPQDPVNYEEISDFTMPPNVHDAQIDQGWKQHTDSAEPVGTNTKRELIDSSSPPNISAIDLDPARLLPLDSSQDQNLDSMVPVPPVPRYPTRSRTPSIQLKNYYVNYLATHDDLNPISYDKAVCKSKWVEAIEQEKQAITKMHTCEYVPLPPGQSAISTKWLFKTKYDGNSKKMKRKSRMVVRGNEQEEGVD